VDLELTSDQELVRETTERFIADSFPLSRVRQFADTGAGPDADYAARAAELGWFAFLAPEDHGGGNISGAGVLDAVILAEARGRYLQPGAFIDTNVTISALAADGSTEQQRKVLPALVAGEVTSAWALADPTGDWSGSSGVECATGGGGYRLSGAKGFVVEPERSGWLLVTARAPEGLAQFLVAADTPGVSLEQLERLDLTRRICEVHFDDVVVNREAVVGTPGKSDATLEWQLQLACVLSVAESVGAMDHLFAMTLEYCKDRIAFGRPIGSFQAVKHQLADTSLLLEMSAAVATSAARAVQEQQARAGEQASMAKAFVADAGIELAHNCWQNFGGIAYTWEHDFHLYLRRLTTDAALYGSAAWHRERVCRLEGL
jgi:alkylation response protein AidB-like acyl-CoA dehydrogenase